LSSIRNDNGEKDNGEKNKGEREGCNENLFNFTIYNEVK